LSGGRGRKSQDTSGARAVTIGLSDPGKRLAALSELVDRVLAEARGRGASAAEAAVSQDAGAVVTVRLGDVETVEHTRDNGLGVTVYFGARKGSASTSDLGAEAVADTIAAACDIARHTMEDPCAGLADAADMAAEPPDLDLYHPWDLTVEDAVALALACEAEAMATDGRITNSEGATLNSHSSVQVYGNTNGFVGGYPATRHSLSCAVVGAQGDSMQRDYWWTVARAPGDLDAPAAVGRRAAERALARLGARKLTTRRAPVLFRAEAAVSLLRHFLSAVRGDSLYRRASFLLDHIGKPIFPSFVHIHENPHLRGALGSAPFDGEGVATRARDLISQGVLQGYVLDSYSARKLGLRTTGNAGGVHNLRIDPTGPDLGGLVRQMNQGLVVTELMGQGSNTVTGDYSRGASGFWVENGEVQYPVEEITVAGNLREMFRRLLAVGSDDAIPGATKTGSWLIEEMTIAGD